MLTNTTFNFLRELEQNNNREWFQANKPSYDAAKNEFADFINILINRISQFDDEMFGTQAGECLFRIFRDVRFSKNKQPYKSNFGAYMAPGGRKSMKPGYYIHVDPKGSFIAGGAYGPEPPQLLKIRQNIVENSAEFFDIIGEIGFKKTFGELSSHNNQLANVPKGFARDHQAAEYLKFKNFIATSEIAEADFADVEKLAARFKLLKPLNDFLRKAI